LYDAFELDPPEFLHQPLVTDSSGNRLAKRYDAFSLRALRAAGLSPNDIRVKFTSSAPRF
ncbi:MAG TPA: tRNA glutamyl-Q synthetase, partial [Chthoniobacterales bacterium]|nr:tRNA glutamyl-Q synthetase [Chthoniobacterales bacterium]